ncbi:hypothetical protein FRX31_029525 [Thalictrum thalictroides]|uniref:Uncharacterized protein n=1 Tax=Thalictrum thalictroides TaxID=46969 RepID=A0A7J6V707_THATH|nr:hypothetical protein FRX31_029525 [Thalictrum thalictroides]
MGVNNKAGEGSSSSFGNRSPGNSNPIEGRTPTKQYKEEEVGVEDIEELITTRFGEVSVERFIRLKVEINKLSKQVEEQSEALVYNQVAIRVSDSSCGNPNIEEEGVNEVGSKHLEVTTDASSETTTQRNKNSWASVFGRSTVGKEDLEYIEPVIVDGNRVVHVQSDQFAHIQDKYSKLVVGCFVRRRPAYSYVKEVVT